MVTRKDNTMQRECVQTVIVALEKQKSHGDVRIKYCMQMVCARIAIQACTKNQNDKTFNLSVKM